MKTKSSRKKRERIIELTERLIENKYETYAMGYGLTRQHQRAADEQELRQLTKELNSPELSGIKALKKKKNARKRR